MTIIIIIKINVMERDVMCEYLFFYDYFIVMSLIFNSVGGGAMFSRRKRTDGFDRQMNPLRYKPGYKQNNKTIASIIL